MVALRCICVRWPVTLHLIRWSVGCVAALCLIWLVRGWVARVVRVLNVVGAVLSALRVATGLWWYWLTRRLLLLLRTGWATDAIAAGSNGLLVGVRLLRILLSTGTSRNRLHRPSGPVVACLTTCLTDVRSRLCHHGSL